MIYETVIGIGTVLFLIIVWVLLMKPVTTLVTVFKNVTPNSRWNESVNQTELGEDYDLGEDVLYFSLFFIIIIIFVWIVKISVYQQKQSALYGG